MPRFRRLVACAFLGSLITVSAWSGSKGVHPVALAALPDGSVLVLDREGPILISTPQRRGFRVIHRIAAAYQGMDMAWARRDGQDSVLVLMRARSRAGKDLLVEHSLDGRQRRSADLPAGFSTGIAVDQANGRVYLANGAARTIHVSPLASLRFETFLRIPESDTPGIIAVDAGGRQMFVGDVRSGRVFVIDIPTKRIVGRYSTDGEPRAMAYSSKAQALYIADAGRSVILALRTTSKENPKPLALAAGLAEPSAVAVTGSGQLVLGDVEAGAVFVVGPSGTLERLN